MSTWENNKKGKYTSEYLDLQKIADPNKLTLELRKSQNESLLWLLTELDIQFNNMAKHIKRDNITNYRNFAKQLIPFFQKHAENKNKDIVALCKRGLDLVFDRFPDLKTNE